MSYSIDKIIPMSISISPAGLGTANFAKAMLFPLNAELPVGFTLDTYRSYTSLNDLSTDFPDTTETYKAAQRWLGGTPNVAELMVWGTNSADATITATLNKARNMVWWFWSFFTKTIYADIVATTGDCDLIADWSEANMAYFMNCQTDTSSAAIRDPASTTDIAHRFTAAGYRYSSTFAHATDPYAGIALCKWFAKVNYSGTNTTITGEFKKLTGVAAENLQSTAYTAMTQDVKKCIFYSTAELQGSTDSGRVFNSWSHSSYGEWIDDVVNLEAFVNALKVGLYNVTANQTTKLGQDPVGQAVLIGRARSVCEQYTRNGYLGPRDYTDPDDGLEKYTVGYEILTKAEDILDLSDVDRNARKSASLRVRIFRKGAIHQVPVDVAVY